ncbi:FliM/FliN family flagellar motor switch protein [Variovorax sp. OV700]|uniref:FliM/FliN family flagellar motor switch protein n=1 Tax=Variovorax sp. OV700 TaxID=1882826 RepID=UPI00089053E1|nr:FliM/FliN family flagellar motor switch protein [Variovorax sp. OV700]SDJ59401.1 flagellar motor switch protein FliN/FliY [Variovorax sp. OV700]
MTQALEGVIGGHRAIASHTSSEERGDRGTRPLHGGGMPTAQIIALPELHANVEGDAANPAGHATVLRDWHPLHQIKAKLQVCVGEATVSVGELLAAKEHQVLLLDRAVDQAVDLTIEGKVVARGQLLAVDGHFAVRITELPIALGLASGS